MAEKPMVKTGSLGKSITEVPKNLQPPPKKAEPKKG